MENRNKVYLLLTFTLMAVAFMIGLVAGAAETRLERDQFHIQKIDNGTFYMVTFGDQKKVYQFDGYTDTQGTFRILNR